MSAQRVEEELVAAPGELPPSMVGRMSLILDAFTSPAARLTLETVVRRTGLPRSTTHRILDQLVEIDWLSHGQSGYALGARALTLGGGDGGHAELREAAAPHLHELLVETGLVVHLAVLDAGHVRYLDKLGGRLATRVPSRVGGRSPAHATALGKAILSAMQGEEVDTILAQSMGRLTLRTIGDLPVLHQELHRVRSRGGLAYERGETHPQIACVAAVVRGPEGPVGAISVTGEANTPLERFAPLVLEAAKSTAEDLFSDTDAVAGRRSRRALSQAAAVVTWSPETMDRLVADAFDAWG